jgi:hypothetical protein
MALYAVYLKSTPLRGDMRFHNKVDLVLGPVSATLQGLVLIALYIALSDS